MVLYHLDTAKQLEEGLSVGLTRGTLSIFGHNYVTKFCQYGVLESLQVGDLDANLENLDSSTFREYALEFFRLHHPTVVNLQLPSRLWSFFATYSVEDAIRYAERHAYQGEIRVFEVHAEGEHPHFDMTWLDRSFPKKINGDVAYYLHKYWIGELFEKDPYLVQADSRQSLSEYLVTQSITIGRRFV